MATTLQKAIDDFGTFSDRVKSICDKTVSCFQEISQKIPVKDTESEADVLSTAELNEVQGSLKKTPSVIFIGDRNCGKTSLLNELLRGSFLPVHENPCTSRIVRIVYSKETFAKLITRDGEVLESKSDFKKETLKKFAVLSDADREDPTKLKATVKVGLNHELLRSGIELIDSPGRNENEELDNVLDAFLEEGTVPLIVYIIDGSQGLRRTDRKTIRLLQEKFPQVSFMFVCNKVDTTSEAANYDKDSDEEDNEEAHTKPSKQSVVFDQLKDAKLIPPEASIESHPFFHGVSAREAHKARKEGENNQAVAMFERFEQCLEEKLGVAIKRETKRAVDKLLMLQESFIAAVGAAHTRQQMDSESVRFGFVPGFFQDILNAEVAIKNTLDTLAANQRGLELVIERKLQSLEQNFQRKAEEYKIEDETTIREDLEASALNLGSVEVAFEVLRLSMSNVSLPFFRFVEDMKELILDETFNALKDSLVKTMNDPISQAAEELMRLSEKLQHPAIAQIFQRSYDIEFEESRDQRSHLLLVILDGLLDHIDKIVTIAFRREISGPLSETFSHWEVPSHIKPDVRDKESRRKVVTFLLANLIPCHVAETVTNECKDALEQMHETFQIAILNLEGLIEVLSSKGTSSQLDELHKVYTPRVRGLAVEGLALQFLMDKGPVLLGDRVPHKGPSQFYECLSPSWCYQGEPSVVKVVKEPDVGEEAWKRTSVDLINTEELFVRCGGVHPNLLRVHGWLMPVPDVLHIVMERAETDLLTALRRRLALKKRMKIATDVARGLKALHGASYVYQDLKPETVLLMTDGTAKLNMATPEKPFEETRLGCPFHISPEMYKNHSSGVSYFSYDIYAFGMLLWVLCEGTGEARPQAYKTYLMNSAMEKAVEQGVTPERPADATDACWDLMMACWKDRGKISIDEVLGLVENLRNA